MANEFGDTKKGANGAGAPADNPCGQIHQDAKDFFAEDGRPGGLEAMEAVKAAIETDPRLRKRTGVCFRRALRADVAFANAGIYYDVLSDKVRITERGMLPFTSEGKTKTSWDVWNDNDTTHAVDYLADEYDFTAKGRKDKYEFLDEMMAWIQDQGRNLNPLAMILESVEITDPDADQKLFTQGLHCPDNAYYRETGAMFCAELVRMALRLPREDEEEPKAAWVPIVIGPQGIGKSEFCKRLAVRPEWYGTIGAMNADSRRTAVRKTRGKTVVEDEGLAFILSNRPDAMASYLSDSYDEYRRGKAIEAFPRRHVIVGTTSHSAVPEDLAGNWRVLIVKSGFDRPLEEYEKAYDKAGNWIGVVDPKTGKTIPTPYQMDSLVLQALAVALRKAKAGTDPMPGYYSAEAKAYRKALAAEVSEPTLWDDMPTVIRL